MKFKLTFFLLLIFSCSVSAQKMDVISKDLTVFISQIPYPLVLTNKQESTVTMLKLSVENGIITDFSLSDSADSLYQQAFELAKNKFNKNDIEQNLKINHIVKADILAFICVSVMGNSYVLSIKDKQTYKMNKFNGKYFVGEAIMLPPINPFIRVIDDHR